IDLGLGPAADRRIDYWQESFIPETLAHVVAQARVVHAGEERPLVARTVPIESGEVEQPPILPPDLRWPFLLAGLAIAALVLLGGASTARSRGLAVLAVGCPSRRAAPASRGRCSRGSR